MSYTALRWVPTRSLYGVDLCGEGMVDHSGRPNFGMLDSQLGGRYPCVQLYTKIKLAGPTPSALP
jgi:hypothetical protein